MLLAITGLGGCSGSGAGSNARHDAGPDGVSSYGGSGGGLGVQGGGSSGGDDATPPANADASTASPDAVPPTDSGEASSEASQGTLSSDGGAPPSCARPEGGLPCDPGQVACGSTSCNTGTQFCCVGGGSGASSDVCSAYNGSSCPNGALVVACDETGDCSSGVCCEENVGIGTRGPTECKASCPSGWFQVCRSDGECGDGTDGGSLNRCVLQTCTQLPGLLGGGSSVVIEACAVPPTLGNLGNHGALPGCVAQ